MIISTSPLLQKIAYIYAPEWYHFIFICLSWSRRWVCPLSADIWIWEMPAALLSIRATDLTKQGSRSMSPFVTCHWGTSWAAGTPSGLLGQEGVLQLPVSGRFPLVSCCPSGTSHPNVPSQYCCLERFDLWSTHLDGRLHWEGCFTSITLRKEPDDREAHLGIEIPPGGSKPWSPKDAPYLSWPFMPAHSVHFFRHCCFDPLTPEPWRRAEKFTCHPR